MDCILPFKLNGGQEISSTCCYENRICKFWRVNFWSHRVNRPCCHNAYCLVGHQPPAKCGSEIKYNSWSIKNSNTVNKMFSFDDQGQNLTIWLVLTAHYGKGQNFLSPIVWRWRLTVLWSFTTLTEALFLVLLRVGMIQCLYDGTTSSKHMVDNLYHCLLLNVNNSVELEMGPKLASPPGC